MLLAMLGEQFPDADEILGVYLSIKPYKDRLEIWHRTSSNEGINTRIEETIRLLLNLPSPDKF